MYNNTIRVTTSSGNTYQYEPYKIGTSFNSVGGNYIFAYLQGGTWIPLYVGQTNDFSARFANHGKLPIAMRKGATHILVSVNNNEQARKKEEAELIAFLQPACNDLLK